MTATGERLDEFGRTNQEIACIKFEAESGGGSVDNYTQRSEMYLYPKKYVGGAVCSKLVRGKESYDTGVNQGQRIKSQPGWLDYKHCNDPRSNMDASSRKGEPPELDDRQREEFEMGMGLSDDISKSTESVLGAFIVQATESPNCPLPDGEKL